MIRFIKLSSLILFLLSEQLYPQTTETKGTYFDGSKRFSVQLYGTYISSAELQNDPKSSNPIERDASIDLSGGYGYGGEVMYDPGIYNVGIQFYLSSEYIKVNDTGLEFILDNGSTQDKVRMSEKYSMGPVEFGLKWNLPVTSDNFKIYIGGGGGVYFGDRVRTIANLQSSTLHKIPGFSVNILSGLEYFVGRNISANAELKFREASFDVESKFKENQLTVNGTVYQLINPFYSRIIVDGVRISLGLKYHF